MLWWAFFKSSILFVLFVLNEIMVRISFIDNVVNLSLRIIWKQCFFVYITLPADKLSFFYLAIGLQFYFEALCLIMRITSCLFNVCFIWYKIIGRKRSDHQGNALFKGLIWKTNTIFLNNNKFCIIWYYLIQTEICNDFICIGTCSLFFIMKDSAIV